jgi:hypothetical protein
MFPSGKWIDVSAKWGWPEVPEYVIEATMELTAIWQGSSPRSTGRMNELDEVVSMSPMAMGLVKRFVSAATKVRVA